MNELSAAKHAALVKQFGRFPIDFNSGIPVMIDVEHRNRHGETFMASVAAASAASVNIAFKTGAKELHTTYHWESESKANLKILEAASWTTNTGTAVASTNTKRDSTIETDILEDKTATPAFTATKKYLRTVTSPTGTELTGFTEYTFSAKAFGGGVSRSEGEIVLKPNTAYVFVLTSDDGSKGLGLTLAYYGNTPAS